MSVAPKRKQAPAAPGKPDFAHSPRLWRQLACRFGIGASIAGVTLRIAMLLLAPRYGYVHDHDDFVRWGIQATDRGLLTLYDGPPPRWNIRTFSGGAWSVGSRTLDRPCNYPPGMAYLLDISGQVFKVISRERLINTVTSRAVFAAGSIVADFLLAAGCAAVVSLVRPGRAVLATYAMVLLVPPFWWDSCVWGQVDSVFLAPMMWMIWAMLGGRWRWAGLLFGLAAMLKPQAILLVPIWLGAIVMIRPVRKPLWGLVAAAGAVFALSLPFTLHSGMTWLQRSYVENILEAYPATTLYAFNLWYVDLLIRDSNQSIDALFGLTRDLWGRVAWLIALAVGFIWLGLRRQQGSRVLLWWSCWVLLASVMLPTRVHERYLLIALPPLIVVSMACVRLWPGTLALLVVATAQVTWPLWLPLGAGGWPEIVAAERESHEARLASLPPDQRAVIPSLERRLATVHSEYSQIRGRVAPFEWSFTLVALAATGWIAVSLRKCGGPRSTDHLVRSCE